MNDNLPDTASSKKKVLVLGGGFGGVFAAKALEKLGRGKLDVELINSNNYFVFQPLLPEVAASSIHSADAVVPLRQLLRRIQVRQAEVMGIDFDKRKVIVVQGTRRIPVDLPYDELVIAFGTGVDLNRFPGLPEHALTMKNLADAHRLRTHVIGCLETADVTDEPEIKQQLLTFVVVGAGFSGVETVAEMRELVRRALKYYPNIKPDEIRFYLIEYADRILPTFSPDLAEYATRRLEIHGIEVLTRVGTKSATGTGVELTDGRFIPTSTIVATIGNGPHRLVETLGLDMHWGRIKTDQFMRVPGKDGVWALGDAALIPMIDEPKEDPLHYAPQTAQFAVREGRQLAANIVAKLNGKEMKPFAYVSKGSLASLGMSKAVADVYGVKLSGTFAWLLWRGFYLSFLPGFQREAPRRHQLAGQQRDAAEHRADPVDAARHALHPLPQGRQGVRAGHADRRLLYGDQGPLQADHRQPRCGRAFREGVLTRRAFRRARAAPLGAPHRARRGAGRRRAALHRAEGLHPLRPRLPVPRQLFQGLYRADLRRVRQILRARQHQLQNRAGDSALGSIMLEPERTG